MKSRHIVTCVLTWSILLSASVSCGGSDRSSPAADQATDSLPAASTPVALGQTDSLFVSEPSALAITDAHIYIADAGTSSILVYGRDGVPVTRIGRRGRGPGEFVAPASLASMDEGNIAIVDAALKRLSIVDSTMKVVGTLRAPGQAMSLSRAPGGVVLGVQDPIGKTSVAFVNTSDSTIRSFGPLPRALLQEPQLAASYPFSVVTANSEGFLVGFTGSGWLYRLRLDGSVVDSVNPAARRRRGVPDDLGERLRKSTAPENEAASTSMLVALAPLSGKRTAMLHMDFVVDGPAVTGKAFLSALGSDMRARCTDVIVPLSKDTRPMFAFRGDTLFVVQNIISSAGGITTQVSAFLTDGCR